MEKIEIKIDGYSVTVPAGIPLIEALRESGFWIPGLCHHPDLKPQANCRLCVIELDGASEPVLACTINVEDGMSVRTESEKIHEKREDALRKILANHPHGCLDCEQRFICARTSCVLNKPVYDRCCGRFDECELRMLTEWMGIPKDTPEYVPRDYPRIIEQEVILRDYNLCISCTRCARACRLFEGLDIYRDYFPDGKLDPSKIQPLTDTDCTMCGFCMDACPTGALSLLDTDYGYLGYFPIGTSGRMKITPPPPSHKMSLELIDLDEIPTSPGRVTIYDVEGGFVESRKCPDIRKCVASIKDERKGFLVTIQADY